MPIKQISLFVENRPGSLSKACRTLKDEKINIYTLSLADTAQFGILRLLVKEYDRAADVLGKAGFLVKMTDVLAISVPDHPGGLADILTVFDKYNLQLEYIYAFTFGRADRAAIVVRVEDPDHVIELLKNEPVEFIGPDALFKLAEG